MLDAWLAPFIIALRLPRLAGEASRLALGQADARGLPETERMMQEKVAAFQKGVFAAGHESMASSLAMAIAAMKGQPLKMAKIAAGTPARVTSAALEPVNRTMRANARRLTRR